MNQLDINEIKKFLPHRYPFLLIDKILDAKPGEFLKALKNVTVNEPFFQGHFPERPVMPGVLMVEAMAQAAGLLIMCTLGATERTNEMYFLAGIDQARFKRLVEPGDQLILDIKLLRAKRDIWKFEGSAYVNDELACSAEIINARGHAHDS